MTNDFKTDTFFQFIVRSHTVILTKNYRQMRLKQYVKKAQSVQSSWFGEELTTKG